MVIVSRIIHEKLDWRLNFKNKSKVQWRLLSISNHKLIKITDRTLDVVFSRFKSFSFTLTQTQKPKEVKRNWRRTFKFSLVKALITQIFILKKTDFFRNFFCLRVIEQCTQTDKVPSIYVVLKQLVIKNIWFE